MLQIDFAIFVGVLTSLFVYLNRTTHPQLTPVAPDPATPNGASRPSRRRMRPQCPQLAMLRVDGSLFFGAVEHVHDELQDLRARPCGGRIWCC
jgi:SulP family sulfate permease